jgi:riboflavin kinase/FMN adenylyltransferase
MEKLREWVKGTAVALHEVEAVSAVLCDMTPVPVSSSLVRWLVANGRVRDAGICLARPYVLEGVVVEGFKRGRTIGVPTANLRVEGQVVPIDGVYAGRCVVDGKAYPAATSIGRMPTFGEGLPHQVEAHLVGFDGDLYGRTLRLDLLDYLREQWKLPDIGSLKRQIERDVERTVALAGGSARADERGAGVRPA